MTSAGLRAFAASALAYTALTVLLTWPVAATPRTRVPMYNDTWIFVWDVHEVRAALLDPRRRVFETGNVFWPDGISLAFHTLAPLYGALAIPLEPVLGLIATYNLFFLGTFVASALAMQSLAAQVTGSRAGAFIAGALFAFSPYHQAHAPHLNLLSLQFLPLSVRALLALLERATVRSALALAVTAVLSFYACLEYAFFTAGLAALFLAYAVITRGRGAIRLAPARALAGRSLLAGAVTFALALPGLLPIVAEAAVERHYDEPVDVQFSADLLSWATPSVLHSLWGGYTMKVYQHFPGVLAEWTTFIGVTVAALVLFALARRRRLPLAPWLAATLVFGLLAMGPSLRLLGQPLPVPLPYRAIKALPVLSAMREPSRFTAVVTLATSVLAAFAVRELAATRRGRAVAAAALPLALLEFVQVPYATSSARTPAFLETIARERGSEAVLDVPAGLEIREHLYHQAVHGRPIFVGYVARIPAASRRFIETLPLLRDPSEWPRERRPGEDVAGAGIAALLRLNHVGYALVHEEFYARRHDPHGFERALEALLAVPGSELAAREPGFAAVRFANTRVGPARP